MSVQLYQRSFASSETKDFLLANWEKLLLMTGISFVNIADYAQYLHQPDNEVIVLHSPELSNVNMRLLSEYHLKVPNTYDILVVELITDLAL